MGLKLVKEAGVDQIPIFQKEFEVAQGGFLLDTTGLPSGELVTPGTPVGFDEKTRKVNVLKTAVLYEDATAEATTYKVNKGHFFAVDENLAASVGDAAYAITDIDTSKEDYDTLTVGTTLGVVLDIGDVLFQSSAEGEDAAALNVTPKGLLFDNVKIEDNVSCAVVLRGTVYKKRVANGIPDDVVDVLPLIVFSESY